MAVTKIWKIKGKAGSPLTYVANPEKTQRQFTESEQQALADVIAYAANEDKTEKLNYTSGINCTVECARDQFDTVKLRFSKTDGIVAFHTYQSFKEGEVTPDEAHAKMTNMESMTLHLLRFSVDGKEINVKDVSEWEPGTTWVTKGGAFAGIKQADHTQWEEGSNYMQLLDTAVDAKEVEMEMIYTAIVLHGEAVYGCSYWCTDKPIADGLLGSIERKMLEYYDQDDSVW